LIFSAISAKLISTLVIPTSQKEVGMNYKTPVLSTQALLNIIKIEDPEIFKLIHNQFLLAITRIHNESDWIHVESVIRNILDEFIGQVVYQYSQKDQLSAPEKCEQAIEALDGALGELKKFLGIRS